MISAESLFEAWGEFRKGTRAGVDVQEYERHLEKNIFRLQRELKAKTYRHGAYGSFLSMIRNFATLERHTCGTEFS